MNILITGASGFIGQHVIKRLLSQGFNITACIHRHEIPYDIKIFRCDFTRFIATEQWLPYLRKIDVVINCVGIITESSEHDFEKIHVKAPTALFNACEVAGVQRVIQLSALGIAEDDTSVAYQKSKKAADEALINTNLEWFILKPSLVYGEGGKSFHWFKKLSQLPWIPLIDGGYQLIQPIHVDVLVDVIEKCMTSAKTNHIIDVVGQQTLTYQQWMKQLNPNRAQWRFVNIPMWLAKSAAWLLKPLTPQFITSDNLSMLDQHNTADPAPMNAFLEHSS